MKARAITLRTEYDSKAEAEYAQRLELLKRAGEILDWRYAPANWRLARPGKKSWFRPDFLVVTIIGRIEWHEVKGARKLSSGHTGPFWRGDARPKAYAAAELYPWFRWVIAWKSRGNWHIEDL